ncbi:hypothetical protein QBC37DRAFT_454518 [Rhypophila decipiens]|uniref:AAA+ ATPase domain-containing protein n=1 Tax=Rhypophila decipiens TaxID=261697 RepID=A0AAN6YCI0_9PEZI|nr:hypothetical protein QBC37DRAFT_454518 [Rhypophila decipiens]
MRGTTMEPFKKDINDDASSDDSYEELSPTVVERGRLRGLIARVPGKQALSDDEMPDVLYTVQYCDTYGVPIETRESDQPIDPNLLNNLNEHGDTASPGRVKPVIEIKSKVTSVLPGSVNIRRASPPRGESYDYDDGFDYPYGCHPPPPGYSPHNNRYKNPVSRERFQVEKTEMKVHSPELIAALAAVVGYYPDIEADLSTPDKPVTFEEPYCELVHHWRELESYKLNQPACHDRSYAATTEKHIDILLGYLRKHFDGKLEAEWARWNNPHGKATATFEMFWMLLKPGEVVYLEKFGEMVPHMVSGVSPPSGATRSAIGKQGSYILDYWSVEYHQGHLKRHMESTYIMSWVGEREISSLPAVPARFVDGGAQGMKNTTEKHIRLGRLYWELAKGPAYKEYDGELITRDSGRGGNMTGRVIVDCEGSERFWQGPKGGSRHPPGKPPGSRSRNEPSPPSLDYLPPLQPKCSCSECKRNGVQPGPSPFDGFEKRDPKQDSPPENEDLYFLVIKNTIRAFVLGERRWASVRLENLQDVKPDKEAFKYLVLDPEIKMTVKALIGKFASSDGKVSPWPNDFVKNKGEGRIFLLHGSPGVGKTCTAECIAELTHRPLLSLTSGDISTSMSASSVERNLHYFLELGERFGALVLLDEADVYLEERRTRDLRRNGLVSIFLRALEYYRGVLFLTTNRVEAFDSAFTSRIHVALHYRRLNDDDRRRVWMHNFERLERDSAGKCYVPQSAREYAFESHDMKTLRWNGREIRNGLQTAVALAETEAVENGVETVTLTDKHLRAVVKMSSGFRDFLKKSKGGRNRKYWDGGSEDDDGDSNEEEDEDEEEEGSVSSAETEDNHKWADSTALPPGYNSSSIPQSYHQPPPPPPPAQYQTGF